MASDVFGIVGSTVAGAFRVEAVVAEGGFAVVYRAYHEGFRAPVALKCLKIPVHMDQKEQDRFERRFGAEAELLFKLSAAIPTVVRPLHVEVVQAPDGTVMPFLALEWLEGETLDAVARRRRREGRPRFALGELVTALAPVARALERAHHFKGTDGPVSIVHCDLKPENIFIARVAGERVVKILDFGIAQAMSTANQVVGSAADVGAGPFTPAYAAPEQWTPERFGQTGPWTDVWGLALTLVELLAGRPVMDGDNAAMMRTALDPARRPTPRTEGAPVSDAVESVFARALALDPRERYRDVGEFWRALVQAANEACARSDSIERAAPSGAHVLGQSMASVPVQNDRATATTGNLPEGSIRNFEPRSRHAELAVRFGAPAAMVLAGILMTFVDGVYASAKGEVFTIGPIRPAWIAGALVLGGIGLAFARFRAEP